MTSNQENLDARPSGGGKFIIIVFFFIVIVFTLSYQLFIPFRVSSDMVDLVGYTKRILPNRYHHIFNTLPLFTNKTEEYLQSADDSELIGLRCSDKFARSYQGVYIFEPSITETSPKKRIKNQKFIEYMKGKEKNLTKGKKILIGSICETEDKTILLMYSIGSSDFSNADKMPVFKALFNSFDNEAYIEILPKGTMIGSKTYKIAKSSDHLYCTTAFQVDKKKTVYLLCSEEKAESSNHFVYGVNLKSGKITEIEKCLNDFSSGVKTECS